MSPDKAGTPVLFWIRLFAGPFSHGLILLTTGILHGRGTIQVLPLFLTNDHVKEVVIRPSPDPADFPGGKAFVGCILSSRNPLQKSLSVHSGVHLMGRNSSATDVLMTRRQREYSMQSALCDLPCGMAAYHSAAFSIYDFKPKLRPYEAEDLRSPLAGLLQRD